MPAKQRPAASLGNAEIWPGWERFPQFIRVIPVCLQPALSHGDLLMMSRLRLCLFLMLGAVAYLRADTTPILTGWDRLSVAPMKTSIYVGSVILTTGVFEREGSTLATTYVAKVRPWFFWGETGKITLTLTDTDLANLAKGGKAQFTGAAFNHRNKPRQVTGRAEPANATSGKFKVRIIADGVELIFNGTYQLAAGQTGAETPPTPPSGK
jgi:hypothetical protein